MMSLSERIYLVFSFYIKSISSSVFFCLISNFDYTHYLFADFFNYYYLWEKLLTLNFFFGSSYFFYSSSFFFEVINVLFFLEQFCALGFFSVFIFLFLSFYVVFSNTKDFSIIVGFYKIGFKDGLAIFLLTAAAGARIFTEAFLILYFSYQFLFYSSSYSTTSMIFSLSSSLLMA